MKKIWKIGVLLIICVFIFSNNSTLVTYSKDLREQLEYTISNYESTEKLDHDANSNGVIDIIDVAYSAYNLAIIDVKQIKNNYVKIVSTKDKQQYETIGYKILSQNCLPVTKDGIDLFAYVNAARGMRLEILEGDNSFTIENDKLYLVGQSPSIAKVRLVNEFAISEEFYIYGTTEREIHDFTYDFLISSVQN